MELFKIELKAAMEATRGEQATFAVGDHCRFCHALPFCPEYKKITYDIARTDFKDELSVTSLPPIKELSLTEAIRILKFKPLFDNFCKQVESNIYTDLMNGHEVEGFKLVSKRKIRKWKDEKTVVSYLEMEGIEDVWESSLKSPSQIEKMVGKANFKDLAMLIDDSEGDPTLAFSDDKRPAITRTSAKQDFAQINEQE